MGEKSPMCARFKMQLFNMFIFFAYAVGAALIRHVDIFNSSEKMDDLCVTCMFVLEAGNSFCSMNIEQNNGLLYSFQVVQSNGTSIAADCITHLPGGIYNVTVYENSCNENSLFEPIFTYHNFTILATGTQLYLNV